MICCIDSVVAAVLITGAVVLAIVVLVRWLLP